PGLGDPLRDAAAEGESAVHQVRGQVGHLGVRALVQRLWTETLRECDAVLDGRRQRAVEQVRRVYGVPAGSKLLGERPHPVGEPLHVVKEYDFGHFYYSRPGRRRSYGRKPSTVAK